MVLNALGGRKYNIYNMTVVPRSSAEIVQLI